MILHPPQILSKWWRVVDALSHWLSQARIQDRRSEEGAHCRGAPFLAQVGAKSYRGAPIFASCRGGLGAENVGPHRHSKGRHHLSGGAEGRWDPLHWPPLVIVSLSSIPSSKYYVATPLREGCGFISHLGCLETPDGSSNQCNIYSSFFSWANWLKYFRERSTIWSRPTPISTIYAPMWRVGMGYNLKTKVFDHVVSIHRCLKLSEKSFNRGW